MWVKVIACELYAVLHSQAGVRSKGIFCGVNTMSALPPKADNVRCNSACPVLGYDSLGRRRRLMATVVAAMVVLLVVSWAGYKFMPFTKSGIITSIQLKTTSDKDGLIIEETHMTTRRADEEAKRKADEEAKRAFRLNPKNLETFLHRGAAYASRGDNDLAIADYSEAIRLDPQYADAFYRRGVIYAFKGENRLAIADYSQAIRLDPKNARAFCGRAK
jgi:cytochrome c-type biogenesis protein CcmH/NrfG